ncbi:MAG: hypothetical protein R3258_09155, partial [Acidimicrobiia bacterium]|nr:hypothetical protein [Acidimicrobiia bacterium]
MSGQGPTPAFSVKRASFGFLFGVLGGMGASIVLTQNGTLDVALFWQVALIPCVLAAIWAGTKTPPLLDRLVQWVTTIIAIGSIFLAMLPASAQVRECQFEAWTDAESTVNGESVAAGDRVGSSRTTESGPWVIDLDEGSSIFFEIATGEELGAGRVQLESSRPLPLAQDDTYLWTGTVSGQATDRIAVVSRDFTGVVVESNGVQARVVEFGLMQITGQVTDNTGTICSSTAWVRLVDEPFTNVVGLGGAGSLVIGAVGLLRLGRTKRRERPPEEDEKDGDGEATEQPGRIPSKAPHAHVESSLFDSTGQPVEPNVPL